MKVLVAVLTLAQVILAVRVIARLLRTGRGTRVGRAPASWTSDETVSVIVPVLNEIDRLGPCLVGLIAQGQEVAEILVVDGGSTDGTQALADGYAQRDQRIRLIDAAPVPPGRNGKAYGLHVGYGAIAVPSQWVLTIDADVRPDPQLVRSLLAHAAAKGVPALSAATLQVLSGRAEAVVHPAMLASWFTATASPARRQHRSIRPGERAMLPGAADGDRGRGRLFVGDGFGLRRRDTGAVDRLKRLSGRILRNGSPGAGGHVSRMAGRLGQLVALAPDARPLHPEGQRGWPGGGSARAGAAPLAGAAAPRAGGHRHPATMLNVALLCTRIGTLVGMARAYEAAPWTYWLSPVADLPVAV